jgi:hypothetical protein
MTAAIALGASGSAMAASAVVEEAGGLENSFDTPFSAPTEPREGGEAHARAEISGSPPDESIVISEPEPRLRGSSFGQPAALLVDAGELRFDGARAYTFTVGAALGPIRGQILPRYDLTASLASFVTPPGGESSLFGPFQVHWAVLGPMQMSYADDSVDAWGLETGGDACSAFTYDTGGWVALACAEFGAGWLFAEVSSGSGRRASQTRGYGFGGLAFDGQYNLGSLLHVGLRAGARLITPFSAEAPDGTRLFDSSTFGAYATLGFGLHF